MRTFIKVVAGSVAVLFLASCASMYGVTKYNNQLPKKVSNGTFEVTITMVNSYMGAKDYHMKVSVKNLGKAKAVFNSSDLTLVDAATGVSYFSISKDSQSVSLPRGFESTLTTRSLEAGQVTTGLLWFTTPAKEANAKRLKLTYGSGQVELEAD